MPNDPTNTTAPEVVVLEGSMFNWLEYRDGYKYQLAKDYTHRVPILGYTIDTEFLQLNPEGFMTLKRSYATDGPSGLTFDTRNSIRGAFIHDAIYWLIRNGLIEKKYKELADILLRDICIEDGMFKVRAYYWYYAVSKEGIHSLYPSSEKTILRAP